jgi:hypothetical protein
MVAIESTMEKIARIYSESTGVKIIPGITFSTDCKGTITIPPVSDQADEWVRFMIETGVYHEVGHILYTDSNKNVKDRVLHLIVNFLEDSRIEREMVKKWKGIKKKQIAFYKRLTEENVNKGLSDANTPMLKKIMAVTTARVVEHDHKASIGLVVPKDVEDVWNRAIQPFMEEIFKIETQDEVNDISKRILEKVKDLIKEEPKQNGNKSQKSDNTSKDTGSDSQGEASDEDDSQKDNQEGSDNTQEEDDHEVASDDSKNQDETLDDNSPDNQNEDTQEENKGDAEDESEDNQDDQNSSDGNEEVDRDDREVSNESEDNSAEEDKDNNPGDSEEEQTETGDNKEDSGQQAKNEPSTDADNPEGKEDGSESAEGDQEDSEGSDSEKDDKSGSDSSEGEESGDQSSDNSEEENKDGSTDEDSEDPLDEEIKKQLEDELNGNEELKTLSEDLIDEINKYADATCTYREDPSVKDIIRERPEVSYWGSNIKHHEQAGRKLTGYMGGRLRTLLISERAPRLQRHLKSGRLDLRKLHNDESENVFQRKTERVYQDSAVSMVIDNSGSMNGPKAEIATNLLVSLAGELDNLRVPFEVVGFTTAGQPSSCYTKGIRTFPIYINVVKRFEELYRRVRYRFVWPDYTHNTVEFPCIRYAAQRLVQRKETKKILFIITDGETESGASDLDSALRRVTKEYIERLTRAGVYVVGFGIKNSHIAGYCKDHIIVSDLNTFAKELYAKLSQMLLKN